MCDAWGYGYDSMMGLYDEEFYGEEEIKNATCYEQVTFGHNHDDMPF